MKVHCKCGNMVPETEGTVKYRSLQSRGWFDLLEKIDSEIETLDASSDDREATIMRIRYLASSTAVMECDQCGRLITFCDGEVVFLKRDG